MDLGLLNPTHNYNVFSLTNYQTYSGKIVVELVEFPRRISLLLSKCKQLNVTHLVDAKWSNTSTKFDH